MSEEEKILKQLEMFKAFDYVEELEAYNWLKSIRNNYSYTILKLLKENKELIEKQQKTIDSCKKYLEEKEKIQYKYTLSQFEISELKELLGE